MLEGEMRFELEGEPERLIRAGEAFWEPGGDVIHYQDGNNRIDIRSRFLVTMLCVPGEPNATTTRLPNSTASNGLSPVQPSGNADFG